MLHKVSAESGLLGAWLSEAAAEQRDDSSAAVGTSVRLVTLSGIFNVERGCSLPNLFN